jgi:hypothetical protein
MLMFMLQWLDSRVWVSEVQLTSSSSSARGRLGDGGTVRNLVVAITAGADDAMPARREKAIFGFSRILIKYQILMDSSWIQMDSEADSDQIHSGFTEST